MAHTIINISNTHPPMVHLPISLRGYYFLQNGPGVHGGSISNPLDGRGHITCVDLTSGRVTEALVPGSPHVISLTDVMERPRMVTLTNLLNGGKSHGGTCNTAVVMHQGKWHAVEEASYAYELRFDGSGIVGGRFTRNKLAAHPLRTEQFHYLASRRQPLSVNDRPVPWVPEHRPFVMHSCGRASGNDHRLVFPLMATCFGDYGAWLRGEKRIPFEIAQDGWLVHDTKAQTHVEIPGVPKAAPSDVFHVAAVRREADPQRLAVFACHVQGFADFAQDPSAPVRFSFEKHVLDLDARRVVAHRTFEDAAGDFPNVVHVDANTLLINKLGGQDERKHTELVLFDLAAEEVKKVCYLPHATGDVVSNDGRFAVYTATDEVVIYDLSRDAVHRTYPIPPRFRNFHASLLRAPSRKALNVLP